MTDHGPAPSPSDPSPHEPDAVGRALVADLRSGERRRILHAVWTIIATRDPQVLAPLVRALPAIEEATADAELGGMLASNDRHLDHALDRLELVRAGTCLCAAYPQHEFYEPAKEQARGHIRIVGTAAGEPWQREPDRLCECADCGRRFQVEEGESHFPWWKWREPPA